MPMMLLTHVLSPDTTGGSFASSWKTGRTRYCSSTTRTASGLASLTLKRVRRLRKESTLENIFLTSFHTSISTSGRDFPRCVRRIVSERETASRLSEGLETLRSSDRFEKSSLFRPASAFSSSGAARSTRSLRSACSSDKISLSASCFFSSSTSTARCSSSSAVSCPTCASSRLATIFFCSTTCFWSSMIVSRSLSRASALSSFTLAPLAISQSSRSFELRCLYILVRARLYQMNGATDCDGSCPRSLCGV
mmetsp:Transcript_6234/g.14336  ORF Transcript_6234/g.14336 Transcript_6234/m.14336 type:complete len:251 (-) Transcript_6234:130-882(-)